MISIKLEIWIPEKFIAIFVSVSFAPFESADGIPTIMAVITTAHAAFLRLHFFSSTNHDPGTSIIDMVEVSAAIHNNKKKKIFIFKNISSKINKIEVDGEPVFVFSKELKINEIQVNAEKLNNILFKKLEEMDKKMDDVRMHAFSCINFKFIIVCSCINIIN